MSKVYYTDMRTTPKRNLLNKIEDLINRLKIDKRFKKDELIAIKVHFGEKGNTSYLRPIFLRTIADCVKKTGAKPFLTDTNTLYKGSRSDGISHYVTAIENGFGFSCTSCPIFIADGLKGKEGRKVPVKGEVLKEVSIAKGIIDADGIVGVTHFKAHELSGFGGTLKNLGMGCATREGKLIQHSGIAPKVNTEKCTGCRQCTHFCPSGAITVSQKKASINEEKCIGCGECILICQFEAMEVQWCESQDVFQKKMVEHAAGALSGKEKKSFFLNFLIQISPACDCYPNSDAPIVRDIGILASFDPVSIDAASCDLVNNEQALPGTAIKKDLKDGMDKWKALYPAIDWRIQLDYAEKLGLGEKAYTLIKI
ncbi:MAG: DUF362 domain-containing protein [Syntrophorhabdaceae bacterium]|nr:DUF362 domain-containing protein [Syntrophorhabdaceae bacterium]